MILDAPRGVTPAYFQLEQSMTSICAVTCVQLDDDQRLRHPTAIFGVHFPFRVEPLIYTFAGTLSRDYRGGYWEMYALCNGGYYMAPNRKEHFHVACENGYLGRLSADALGITACLYIYSQLSFGGGNLADICARQHHLLRELMLDHPEAEAILAATD